MPVDVETASVVRTVQDAALERALLDEADTARYVAFAGRLESLRRDADDADRAGFLTPLLTASLLARTAPPPREASAPSDGAHTSRVEGAVLAYRRFDIDVARAARLAGRSREDFEALLDQRKPA